MRGAHPQGGAVPSLWEWAMDVIFAGFFLFAALALVFFTFRQIIREYRADKAVREAYGLNEPSWKDVLK